MKLQSVYVVAASAFLASALGLACAESASDIPGDESNPKANDGTTTDNSQTLPPSNPAGGSTTSSSGASSTSSSGGSTTSSSGSTTSSSGGSTSSSGGSSVPACTWASDITKVLAKMNEIQAGAPCDSSCNPATHCCLDLFGGGGGSGGLPLDAGTSSGGGMPTGGSCVSNN